MRISFSGFFFHQIKITDAPYLSKASARTTSASFHDIKLTAPNLPFVLANSLVSLRTSRHQNSSAVHFYRRGGMFCNRAEVSKILFNKTLQHINQWRICVFKFSSMLKMYRLIKPQYKIIQLLLFKVSSVIILKMVWWKTKLYKDKLQLFLINMLIFLPCPTRGRDKRNSSPL